MPVLTTSTVLLGGWLTQPNHLLYSKFKKIICKYCVISVHSILI